jgi:hypothetical protein
MLFDDTPEPPKIETRKLEEVVNATCLKDRVCSPTLLEHIGNLKYMMVQTVDTLPGMYHDFSVMHAFMVNDIDTLLTQVDLVSESQKAHCMDTTSVEARSNIQDLHTSIKMLTAE